MRKVDGNKRDPIHMSDDGYKLLFVNCVNQYYHNWLLDTTVPTVQSITRVDPSPTELNEVSFLVTFSEGMRGLDAGDFQLSGSAALGAGITAVSGAEDSAERTVTVNISSAANGTLGLDFLDNGSAYDSNWNAIGGEGTGNGDYTLGEYYVIDRSDPTPEILPNVSEPSDLNSVPWTVTFNKGNRLRCYGYRIDGTVRLRHRPGGQFRGQRQCLYLQWSRAIEMSVSVTIPAGACTGLRAVR